MRVVALFRVSTEKQANEGASLDAQQREFRALAAKHGWTIAAEFRGIESATQAATERRVLQQVLAYLRDHGADALWVYEQSRLTRGDELEVALLMRELRERGLRIIVRTVVRDLGSIDERFMVGIQSLVDRAESERIKERMARGRRERARQGKKSCGSAPYGYRNPPPGDPGRGTLRVVEPEAAVVRRVFDLAASGQSERAIARALNGSRVPAPRGGSWGKTTIRRLLDNPAYIGTQASGVWVAEPGTRSFRLDPANPDAVVVENAHPPIVERETWDLVRGRARSPSTARPRMLTGLLWANGVRCAGDAIRGGAFYRSADRAPGGPWLPARAADDAVWDAFVSLASEPAFVERLLEAAHDPGQREIAEREAEYLLDQIGKRGRRRDRLVTMRADGEIDKQEFLRRRDEEDAAIEDLERQLAEQRSKLASIGGSHAARIVGAVRALLHGRARLTEAQKRAVLASIVRRVDVEAERVAVAQERDARGRVLGGRGAAWAIRRVSFRLALPEGLDAAWGGVGADGAGDRAGRVGRPVTTACAADRAACAGEREMPSHRVGRLVTTG